ncbi:glycosyltransferase family 61 protein [Methylobacterium oryzisoli]|uniref:glycosyltransferase family 61 protein n=1 Tax=Methylobacterium oryzisoli TaxID=3385502 RepID=UPI0038920728
MLARPDGGFGLYAGSKRIDGPEETAPDGLPHEAASDATHLFVDPIAPHYGHFVTDTLARLWPLATWEGPRPKLLSLAPWPAAGGEAAAAILGRLGLTPADLVVADRPLRIPHLVVPDPAFRERSLVHRAFGELCRAIGQGLWREDEVDAVARPVYLSKSRLAAGISRIANEEAIVAELDRLGVEIVFPETLPFGEQVRLFSTRRVVMGSTGSAFHTAAFAAPGRRILGLNWMRRVHANFALLDGIGGHSARYYFPLGTRYAQAEAFHFGWTVRDPRGVAAELVERAQAFDTLDARDAAEEAAAAAAERSALGRARSFAAGLRGRISRHLRAAARRPAE